MLLRDLTNLVRNTNKSIPIAVNCLKIFASRMSQYNSEYVKNKLEKELEATHVEVEDFSDGCGAKFNAVIVSPKFEGKSLLERQRLVNAILAEEMKTIHAFTQRTLTPEQWKNKQKS